MNHPIRNMILAVAGMLLLPLGFTALIKIALALVLSKRLSAILRMI